MKTIWNWKNILKTVLLTFICSVIWLVIIDLFAIPKSEIRLIIGFTVGWGSTTIGLLLWPGWHFEDETIEEIKIRMARILSKLRDNHESRN